MSVITLEGLPNTAKKPIRFVRESLYVEPISSCNLACKMCYTNVINGENRRIIDQPTVLDFTRRFVDATPKQVWLYWCGTGEVFLHREFPEMVNTLLAECALRSARRRSPAGCRRRRPGRPASRRSRRASQSP